MLRRELVGAGPRSHGSPVRNRGTAAPGEEILRAEDRPRLRYGAGILFPKRSATADQEDVSTPQSEDETVAGAQDKQEAPPEGRTRSSGRTEADTEEEVSRANEYLPSAMGITALYDVSDALLVSVTAGRYEAEALPGRGWRGRDGTSHRYRAWRRIPIRVEVRLDPEDLLERNGKAFYRPVENGSESAKLVLHVFSRPLPGMEDSSRRMVTLTLLNESETGGDAIPDENCFFQCGLEARSADGLPPTLEYPHAAGQAQNAEQREKGKLSPDQLETASLKLLYRHRRSFAVGHGCAPEWDESETDRTAAIRTMAVPAYQIPPIVATQRDDLDLTMHRLSAEDGSDAIATGEKLCALYEQWIRDLTSERSSALDLKGDLVLAAEDHIRRAEACLRRMRDGVMLLRSEWYARTAFALMNLAMLQQRAHYRLSSDPAEQREWARDHAGSLEPDRPYIQPDYAASAASWYPFQFGFLLMSLPGIFDPSNEDRETVDIIWFPTGGGKTEAYLGLSAFTILLRRLRGEPVEGTTVLMRYTLRLLTTQQFQRAASLICALEAMRRNDRRRLGEEPITIGMWVGLGLTPNTEEKAAKALQELHKDGKADNPFILRNCPWCGLAMGPVELKKYPVVKGYRQYGQPRRVRHVCEDPACEFAENKGGLPVLVVDTALYQSPPTLLLGTVDKFALMPWRPEARAFFGIGRNARPPELIVQDELHLISGPLGSMVGHYETLIDELCRSPEGHPVKVIASTATIARAREQVRGLFGRQGAMLFPPQGLRWGHSFFAKEEKELPGRMYVGIFASGLSSQVTALVRTAATLLQAPLLKTDTDVPQVLDPYWSLITYFNSIRELGIAATLASADIKEYLEVLHERKGISYRWPGKGTDPCRRIGRPTLELTSRVSRGQVLESLDSLFTPTDGKSGSAVDICLATNMIQVGLDVPRLGLMLVAGQPKTTAEYIQATSRVGRDLPGLVVTLLNPGKPRDRSHYEHFRTYHESIYRWVEPTSLTPFSAPVRDRALHALVVTLVRYWGDADITSRPSPPPDAALQRRVSEAILARVRRVDPDEEEATARRIGLILGNWTDLPPYKYGDFAPPDEVVPMMYPDGSQPLPIWDGRALPTPTSMRNVDATCEVGVIPRFIQF